MRIAAIDIGSNSIKLVVAEASTADSLAVIAREKEMVRLGHETLRRGHIAPDAIARAADAIKRFRLIAEARQAERVVAIATASVREADNAAEFTHAIESATGVHVEVLSGIEEARLIGLAAQYGCATKPGAAQLNIDIGGGSTELSLYREMSHLRLFSLKLGAVGLTERYLTSDPARQKELRQLKDEIRGAMERPARELKNETWESVTGTSGTIQALGEALNEVRSKDASDAVRPSVQKDIGLEIRYNHLVKFNQSLEKKNVIERAALSGVSAQRAEIIVAGGQILEGVMRALGIERLRTCEWALREGVILDRLQEWGAEQQTQQTQPDEADPRLRGARAVAARFAYEEKHAHHVAMLAEKIFDGIADNYKLNRHHRTILSAAALLHDVGYYIAHEAHHKHTLYLIKHSELTGFSEAERLIIANVARYHRRSTPKERHPDYMALNTPDRELVSRLSAILRIADALDRSHESIIEDVRVTRDQQNVTLTLQSSRNCEKELWAAEAKSDYFEQIFKRKLILTTRALVTSA